MFVYMCTHSEILCGDHTNIHLSSSFAHSFFITVLAQVLTFVIILCELDFSLLSTQNSIFGHIRVPEPSEEDYGINYYISSTTWKGAFGFLINLHICDLLWKARSCKAVCTWAPLQQSTKQMLNFKPGL